MFEANDAMLMESWDGVIDAAGYLAPSGPNSLELETPYYASSRRDYANGDYYPYWIDERNHGMYRHQARLVSSALSMGCAIESVLNAYTIGNGFRYEAQPVNSASDELAALIQKDMDRLFEVNGWEQGKFESHMETTSRRDGECFTVAYFHNGEVHLRDVAAEYFVEPVGRREDLEKFKLEFEPGAWKYGVHANPNDRQRGCYGYYAQWGDCPADYSYFPSGNPYLAKAMGTGIAHHIKRNVPALVSRGMPDYFPVIRQLVDVAKLVRNMVQGAAAQAAIAWIEEYLNGGKGSAEADAASRNSNRVIQGDGSSVYQRRLSAVTALKVPASKKYLPGPMGQGRETGFEVVAALAARHIGIRWNIPEYMISGDAGSTNYAAALVAESPFVVARQRDQRFFAAEFRELIYKALSMRIAWQGRYERFGVKSLADLKRAVYIHVEPPKLSGHNPLEEVQVDQMLVNAGAMSPETMADRAGLESEVEIERGAAMDVGLAQERAAAVTEQVERALKIQGSLFKDYP